MITTDTQYNVTARKLSKLQETMVILATHDDANPFAIAQRRSLEELSNALRFELVEYDELKSGKVSELSVETLADLPKTLIKARIARGLNQSQLAELLGTKPQQIQRWENDEYSNVGFTALKSIADALNLDVQPRVRLLAEQPVAPTQIRRGLSNAGLPKTFFDKYLMPQHVKEGPGLLDELSARLERLFGFGAQQAATLRAFAQPAMQFKLPGNASQSRTRAYAAYLNGLCEIVSKCVDPIEVQLPASLELLHDFLFEEEISLRAAVERCWSINIAVFATDDSIGMNGAFWKRDRKAVIVLRNRGTEEFRALFDLLHELFHMLTAPDDNLAMIEAEETSSDRRKSVDERRADRFAAEVLTRGRLAELIREIVHESRGQANLLKLSVERASEKTGIPIGVIANLLAKQISDGQNNPSWWAAARSLQPAGEPWKVVRNAFLQEADLTKLDRVETDLIMQLLETSE
ncbi:helix-turn-helix domain-containing protein [Agrobacterium deltaense]|uniref:helix-turn-helix domain-containing protein n=1 Tax=Agrobacterium deltaense TaxID=1183412 RepID=UPI003D96AEC0